MHPSVELERQYGANNYQPLPVSLVKGEGVFVWDEAGNRYFDMMGAYSAVSHGHCHPKLVQALKEQAGQLAVISRAFYSDKLGAFLQRACELTGQDKALPMNTGAEAVETALKAARKWAYKIKGVKANKAEIIACENNFHGRTLAIISMSSEPQYQDGFGPFLPGIKTIRYGDIQALELAITPHTAAFLIEPIQGEGGIIVPPKGYLKKCEELCKKNNVLLICDEVQTGLGRTGKLLAHEHEDIKPDGVILGKALGGGLLPVSLFLARREVMDVFHPGDHGSTFGGNPLAAVVAHKALDVLLEEKLIDRAAELGQYLLLQLQAISSTLIKEVRGRGLMIGVEIHPRYSAHEICLRLLKQGVLTKETHKTVIRLAPPLIISREQIDEVVRIIKTVLMETEQQETSNIKEEE
jgi:ornithine--oxo-acid transaminase